MIGMLRHIHERELRFLALVLITGCLIALHLGEGLRHYALPGPGWRIVDRQALERRIEAGDLSDREADWYHPATEQETRAGDFQEKP
jgi:hypothetical protein